MQKIDMLGLTPDASFSPTERRPFKYLNVSKCVNGVWVKEKYGIEVPWLKPGAK
jgi:hypothetical protein